MMSPLSGPPTRDLGPSVLLPSGCITAPALRSLAHTLDRLAGFHERLGGQGPEAPCLIEVTVGADDRIYARVRSDRKIYALALVREAWEFR